MTTMSKVSCVKIFLLCDVCATANTQTRVPPVAAEGGTSKEEHRRQRMRPQGVQKVLLNCVKPEKESLFGDIPNLNVEQAIETARDREKWKKLRPTRRC